MFLYVSLNQTEYCLNNYVQNVDDLQNRIYNIHDYENDEDTQFSWNINFQKIQSADQY